jgi:addiction module HigA family antidote
MRPILPGEIIAEDIMNELGITNRELAKILHVPTRRVGDIVRQQRPVTADFALRLARWLGTTPEVWLNLQKNYDLETTLILCEEETERTVTPREHEAA